MDFCNFLVLNNTQTRGHSMKLFKQDCHLDYRKFAFSHIIINTWNNISGEDIACDSINVFKCRIDKFLKGRGFI